MSQDETSALLSLPNALGMASRLTKSLCSPLTPTILSLIRLPRRIDSPVCVEVNAGGLASGWNLKSSGVYYRDRESEHQHQVSVLQGACGKKVPRPLELDRSRSYPKLRVSGHFKRIHTTTLNHPVRLHHAPERVRCPYAFLSSFKGVFVCLFSPEFEDERARR
jgi:hypothetical protein